VKGRTWTLGLSSRQGVGGSGRERGGAGGNGASLSRASGSPAAPSCPRPQIIRPRIGRFDPSGKVIEMRGHSTTLIVMVGLPRGVGWGGAGSGLGACAGRSAPLRALAAPAVPAHASPPAPRLAPLARAPSCCGSASTASTAAPTWWWPHGWAGGAHAHAHAHRQPGPGSPRPCAVHTSGPHHHRHRRHPCRPPARPSPPLGSAQRS
jgi:hypothetical protein